MRAARRSSFVGAVLLAALLAVSFPGTAHAEKTIALSSGVFEFTVDAGGQGEGEVVVGNDGDEPLKALVYVSDVTVDIQGEQTFTTPQREGVSLMSTPASWFRISMPADSKSVGNTPYLEINPGENIPIRFEFSPPPGTAPGDHNVLIFFEMFEFPSADGSGAQISGRLGSRVAVRVNGQIIERVAVRPFEVPLFRIGGQIPFRFVINNEGNLNERILATASVLDRSDRLLASSVVATETIILANSGREFRGSITTNPSALGPHTFEISVEYASDGSQTPTAVTEQREVWLVPLWAVVLAGFIIVYGFGYFAWRGLSKRQKGRANDAG